MDTCKKYFPQPWFVSPMLSTSDMVVKSAFIKDYNDKYIKAVEDLKESGEFEEYNKLFPIPSWFGNTKDIQVGFRKHYIYRWPDNWYTANKAEISHRPVILFIGDNDIRENVTESCMSNFYRAPFIVDGIQYLSTEQYLSAQKALIFGDMVAYFKIMGSSDPIKAKRVSNEIRGFDGVIWNLVKLDVLKTGLYHKFTQNKRLLDYLLNTGDAVLAEASPKDKTWGIGMSRTNPESKQMSNWRGANLLGFSLMQVRDDIREVYKNFDKIDFEPVSGLVKF